MPQSISSSQPSTTIVVFESRFRASSNPPDTKPSPSNPRKRFCCPARWRRVTCVIADVRLPGMDGTELQRRIRRERRQLPVIFITAHDDDDVRQQALRDGAVAFLVKPFDGGDLLEHVARATTRLLTDSCWRNGHGWSTDW